MSDPASSTPSTDITHQIREVSDRPVGHGGYSDIYTGVWSSQSGELKVAIKVLRATPNDLEIQKIQRRLETELRVWKSLSHANVQKFSGTYNGIGSLLALVSPWCQNGNIKSFVLRQASSVGPAELDSIKLILLIGVMSGVQFLHESGIVHGDIKGDNVLISDRGTPLLCDFGLSRMIAELSESSNQAGPKGTWRWMAPELCLVPGARHSCGSDIWACGCLFIEVWSSILPYDNEMNQQQFFLAVNAGKGPCAARPANMPDFVWTRVEECCNFDPRQRPLPSHITRCLAERMPHLVLAKPVGTIAGETITFNIASSIHTVTQAASISTPCKQAGFDNAGASTYSVTLNNTDPVYVYCTPHSNYAAKPRSSIDICTTVYSVAWFPDVMRVIVGCKAGSIQVLNIVTGAALLQLLGHTDDVNQVIVSPNGRLVASCSDDRSIRLWDPETGHAIGVPMIGHTDHVWSVAFSPNTRHIVSGSRDNAVRIWSTEACTTVLGPLLGHTDTVMSVAYSPDGFRIVSGSWDHTIRVWDARTGDPIMTLSGHWDRVQSVAHSPDNLHIVSGSYDRTVRIWDATTGKLVGSPLGGHSGSARSVAYSPDGTRIVSSSDDHTIRIWDARTGTSIGTFRGHTDWVYSVAFSPDGNRLASGSDDRTVRIWEATDDWRQ